ncbi:MAG: dicarboxylate/amino acid:cation symporter [Proteobacteria bacterium]|nr:dicarboxylate/amino acid:cation symporter [Pseudomonadota bacterium]
MRTWFEIALWKRILVALLLGIIVGAIWGEGAASIKWIGDLFLRLIRMVIVPLVFVTLVSGIVSMGDPAKLGSLGVKTLAIYLLTTLVAIVIGLILVVLIQPGAGISLADVIPEQVQDVVPIGERLMDIFPENIFAAFAEGNILSIIFFSLLVGIGLLTIGEKGKPLADLMAAGAETMIKITLWVMEVAPFGVFALVAWRAGSQGVLALLDVVNLALAVTIGCVAHVLIMHGILMKYVLKLSPIKFFSGARDAMILAFSTSSSSATLPVSMSVAEENLGISPVVASTVLPLGATINMDGTALYVGIVTVFGAQALGIELSLVDYIIIAGATTLASIGTAAVPSASLMLMPVSMGAIGMSGEEIALIIGFILPFDRPLDMLRTSVNVTGDLSVSTVVANWEGEFDKEIFERPVKF